MGVFCHPCNSPVLLTQDPPLGSQHPSRSLFQEALPTSQAESLLCFFTVFCGWPRVRISPDLGRYFCCTSHQLSATVGFLKPAGDLTAWESENEEWVPEGCWETPDGPPGTRICVEFIKSCIWKLARYQCCGERRQGPRRERAQPPSPLPSYPLSRLSRASSRSQKAAGELSLSLEVSPASREAGSPCQLPRT